MSEPTDFPRTPEGIKGWVESLDSATVMSLAQSISSGAFGAQRWAGGPESLEPGGRAGNEIELPEPPDEPLLLTVHLALDHTEPLIWRRLTIPGDLSLERVHDVLQAAMGWTDSHLHRFHLDDPWSGPYFVTEFDLDEGEDGTLETDARLDQLLRTSGDTLGYTYDFGDDWHHTLRLERVAPPPPNTDADEPASGLVCLDGAGACPPEDVGGIGGHEEMADWVRHGYDPAHAPGDRDAVELDELRSWLPMGWHPDAFSVADVNRELARLTASSPYAALADLPEELRVFLRGVSRPNRFDVDAWLAHPDWSDADELDADTARVMARPLQVVLDAVGEGIALTAAGYLPPRVVEHIFTTLDLGTEWIGKGNREDLTPPVADLREALRSLGLIRKAKGRLLPTAVGRKLRDDPSALVAHVTRRLPLEKEAFGRLSSLVLLIGVAGGAPFGDGDWRTPRRGQRNALLDAVCRVLADAGWRPETGPLERLHVMRSTGPTCDLLDLMLRDAPDAAAPTLARLVLRRTA